MRIVVYNRAEAQRIPVSGRHAYISLTDSDQDPAVFPEGSGTLVDALRLSFDDVLDGADQGRPITPFNESHAGQILDFWNKVKEGIDTLVVHCNGGQCRSPAVAAAIERIETGQDDRWFRTKRPNILVYRTLLQHYQDREEMAAHAEAADAGAQRGR